MRADDHHLDSCWMTWNKTGTRLKVTTYPMLHIGDQSYYDKLASDLGRCQYALLEGVSWRLGDEKRPLYDLVANNLGMVAQEHALRMPPSVTKVNVDMRRSEFRERFLSLPLRHIAVFVFLRRLLWLLTLVPSLRGQAIQHGILRRSWHRAGESHSPLWRLVGGTRDRRIAENMATFFHEHGQSDEPAYVGVVFGAAHMPAISAGLRQLGFRVGTRRWVEVLRVTVAQNGVA
jgi:hypothetical protein